MSSSGFQAAFAHVLVHRDVREALAAHGPDLQARFDLTDDELSMLQSSSASRLGVTATTVGAKRLDFLERALPRASSLFAHDGCSCHLKTFTDAYPPLEPPGGNQVNRLVAEAQRFIAYLERDRPEAPPYTLDLARYELLRLSLSYAADGFVPPDGDPVIEDDTSLKLGRHVALGEYAFDVVSLFEGFEGFESGSPPRTAAPSPTFAAVVKVGPRKLVPYRIGAAVFRMLESWRAPARLRDQRGALAQQLGPLAEAGVAPAARFAVREGILVIVAQD